MDAERGKDACAKIRQVPNDEHDRKEKARMRGLGGKETLRTEEFLCQGTEGIYND